MPDFDGGHYFFTALVPVLDKSVLRSDGSITAASHALREELASLPTAQQSAGCVASGRHSPFSRCHRTHFTRLVVIDQPAFNGRNPTDAIVQSIRKTDILLPQPIDRLACPWLMVIIDFDAGDGEDHGLNDYLTGLWGLMEPEFRALLQYCYGFAEVTSAQGFADYFKRCQIETTMPFNDYWATKFTVPSMTLGSLGGIAGGIALAVLLISGLVLHATGWWWLLAVVVALAAALFGTYRFVMSRARRPFPAGPDVDLKSVLKALYLQQRFVGFVADHQGVDAAALHAAFGAFIDQTRPDATAGPTREPGMIAA